LAGSAPDDEGALELAQESGRALKAEVGEVLADCAFGDGENRQQFKEAGIELWAKVAVQGNNGERFKKIDFASRHLSLFRQRPSHNISPWLGDQPKAENGDPADRG